MRPGRAPSRPSPGAVVPAAILLLCAVVRTAGAASLLPGAARLLDGEPALELSPVLPATPAPVTVLGPAASLALRNDRLCLADWNRVAGRRLDDEDKRALLDAAGSELATTLQAAMRLAEARLPLAGGRRLGLALEQAASAGQRLDLSVLEALLFGNDADEPLEVRRAQFSGESQTRLRLAWSGEGRLPARLPRVGGAPVCWGLGLGLERGGAWTRTRAFSGRVEPPQGVVEARFRHVQEEGGPGLGLSLDLGLAREGRLAGRPLTTHLAMRGLPHLQVWRDIRLRERVYRLPRTPVGTSFDYEAFDAELEDTTSVRRRGALTVVRSPGWLMAAVWRPGAWNHALAAEQEPADGAGSGRRRLSLASRWRRGPLHLTLQLAGGMGRGPALGAALGWTRAPLDLGLGATGYAGLGNRSRGLQTGLAIRWRAR